MSEVLQTIRFLYSFSSSRRITGLPNSWQKLLRGAISQIRGWRKLSQKGSPLCVTTSSNGFFTLFMPWPPPAWASGCFDQINLRLWFDGGHTRNRHNWVDRIEENLWRQSPVCCFSFSVRMRSCKNIYPLSLFFWNQDTILVEDARFHISIIFM